jgi:hypothetical protein
MKSIFFSVLTLTISAASLILLTSCNDDTTVGSAPAADGYPLTTCAVSGEALGSMGDPVVVTHEGTEVRLCCAQCTPKFEADPAKYVALVKAGQ